MGFILLFIIISLLTGFFGWIIYLIYRPIRNRLIYADKLTIATSKKINIGYIILLIGYSFFSTYTAIYPLDSFYKEEFEFYTEVKLPSKTKILKKDASYPDIHGDYASAAVIKLGKDDFRKLKESIMQLVHFEIEEYNQNTFVSGELKSLIKGVDQADIESIYKMKAGWFKIAFLMDGETVFFENRNT